MNSVTLHFNVWQAGAHQSWTIVVDDTRGTKTLDLKRQLFADALKASKKVHFIASGKRLQDTSALVACGLGREAHVHVSISEPSVALLPSGASIHGNTSIGGAPAIVASSGEDCASLVSWVFTGYAVLLVSIGVPLVALWKQWQLKMLMSQLLCICAGVLTSVLLFHGLPPLWQVLMTLPRTSGPKDTSTWGTTATTSPSIDGPSPGATSSAGCPAPASLLGLTS